MPLPLPFVQCGQFKLAPFKDPNVGPYGAFANTTPAGVYPVKQTVTLDGVPQTFNWPSSEHAYHAQKIMHLKSKLGPNHADQQLLTKALRDIENTKNTPNAQFLPTDYEAVVGQIQSAASGRLGTDKRYFDALCDANYHSQLNPTAGIDPNTGAPYTVEFMKTVLKLKLEQNPSLQQTAMDCAQQGIMPVEASRRDVTWASGDDGTGSNMLGILMLELGNEYLTQAGRSKDIAIADPRGHYGLLQQQHRQFLTHQNLTEGAGASLTTGGAQGSPLNVWVDTVRNHTVVERRRNADLQLHFIPGQAQPRVMFRTAGDRTWRVGDIKHPPAQALLSDYNKTLQTQRPAPPPLTPPLQSTRGLAPPLPVTPLPRTAMSPQMPASPPPATSLQSTMPRYPSRKDWDAVRRSDSALARPGNDCFKQIEVHGVLDLSSIEHYLKHGQTPSAPNSQSTMLDKFISEATDTVTKDAAAGLLAMYAVKSVMGDFDVPVRIQMVANNRAGVARHDNDAMKVTFDNQEDAIAFSKRLQSDYGIGSHTHGNGVAKTAQNGSVFLTKHDLEKIASQSKIVSELGTGIRAYETKSELFSQPKPSAVADGNRAENADRFRYS